MRKIKGIIVITASNGLKCFAAVTDEESAAWQLETFIEDELDLDYTLVENVQTYRVNEEITDYIYGWVEKVVRYDSGVDSETEIANLLEDGFIEEIENPQIPFMQCHCGADVRTYTPPIICPECGMILQY